MEGYSERAQRALKTGPDEKLDLTRTHYAHAEVQFIRSLVEIGARLEKIPKQSRQVSFKMHSSYIDIPCCRADTLKLQFSC
jgi:hypothetical protein